MRTVLLLAVFAAPVSAQRIAAPKGPQATWAGAISGAVVAAGQDKLKTLGSSSLARLSIPDGSGSLPLAHEETLGAMTAYFSERRLPLEDFAVASDDDKLALLAVSARILEGRADLAAEAAFAAASPEAIEREENGLAKARVALRNAERLSGFLRDARRTGLAAVRKRVEAFAAAREQADKDFLDKLPARIAAGDFDAVDAAEPMPHGRWRGADEPPSYRHDSLPGFYRARLDALMWGPRGPWTMREGERLKRTVEKDAAILGPRAYGEYRHAAAHFADGNGLMSRYELKAALRRYRSRVLKPAARHVAAIETHYAESFKDSRLGFQPALKAQVLAGIKTGNALFPAWDEVFARHVRLGKRAETLGDVAMRSVVGGLAALFVGLLLLLGQSTLGLWLSSLGVAALAFGWYAASRSEKDEALLEKAWSYELHSAIKDAFPDAK